MEDLSQGTLGEPKDANRIEGMFHVDDWTRLESPKWQRERGYRTPYFKFLQLNLRPALQYAYSSSLMQR